jgi:uncharacterized protein YcfL
MRFGAPRRLVLAGVALLISAWALGGCSSPTKRHYLHHLSIVIEPAEPGSELVAVFETDRDHAPSVASAEIDSNQPFGP